MKNKYMINNYSIRSKLLTIYIVCVLIPIIVTNSLIFFSMKKYYDNEQMINIQNTLDRVKYNLSTRIEESMSIANDLYINSVLKSFLNKKYASYIEFYEEYTDLLKITSINSYYTSSNIYKLTIYTDNNTISDSAYFEKITPELKETKWYKDAFESNKSLILSTYFDRSVINILNDNTYRKISIINKLNDSPENTQILKIDLNYDKIFNEIASEKMNANLYVCNDKNILFSNVKDDNSKEEFKSIDNIKEKDFKFSRSIKVRGTGEVWNVVITADNINVLNKLREEKAVILILILFNLLLPTIVINMVSKSFKDRILLINSYLDKVEDEEFNTIVCDEGKDEIGRLIKSYNLMVCRIKELIEEVLLKNVEKQALELAKKQLELRALQSQINPHFLFNTLESIRMRSLIKGEKETGEIIEKLAVLLRNIVNWGDDTVTIQEEMTFVENYLNIQKYRFGDKLDFVLNVMENCKKIKIPKLSIIGFVENACVHGVEQVPRNASICVTIFKNEVDLFIEIIDTGIGMEEEKLNEIKEKLKNLKIEMLNNSKSIGMINTCIRLQAYSNYSMKFEFDSELNRGTEILIQIPLNNERRVL